ncbi:putative lipid-transfer protein DIR1, partial [Cucurbita argyrosperma subsp. sororia]
MAITALKVVVMVMVVSLAEMAMAVDVCGVNKDGLKACKPWVMKPCPTELPPAACCDGLSKADLGCFCKYKHSMLLSSLGIDLHLALALPAKCSLPNTPSCS